MTMPDLKEYYDEVDATKCKGCGGFHDDDTDH